MINNEAHRLKEYSEWYRREVINSRRMDSFFTFFTIVLPMIIIPVWLCFQVNKQESLDKNKATIFKNEYFKENSLANKEIHFLGMRPSAFKRNGARGTERI